MHDDGAANDSFIGLDIGFPVRVTRSAALLRVADALDSEPVQRVAGLTARVGDGERALWLDGSSGVLLEGRSFKKKAKPISRVFGREVALRLLGEEQTRGVV